jgi:hypothetical protein
MSHAAADPFTCGSSRNNWNCDLCPNTSGWFYNSWWKCALRNTHKHKCRTTNHKCVVTNIKGVGRVGRGNELKFTNAHEISTQLSNPQPRTNITATQTAHERQGDEALSHVSRIFAEHSICKFSIITVMWIYRKTSTVTLHVSIHTHFFFCTFISTSHLHVVWIVATKYMSPSKKHI